MILTSLRLELVSQNYLISILATKDVILGVLIYLAIHYKGVSSK